MPEYDNNMTGVLFRKDPKTRKSDRSPEYSGNCEIDGVEYWISAWIKESKKDQSKFFSLSFQPKDSGGGGPRGNPRGRSDDDRNSRPRNDRREDPRDDRDQPPNDDDIPF